MCEHGENGLPDDWDRLGVDPSSLKIGDLVDWHRIDSNYGHISLIRAVVRRIGKRITIATPLKNGGTKLVSVTPERLTHAAP